MFTSGRYANVTATLALIVALSGTSYATLTISGRDVRDDTITGADIKNGSIRSADIARGAITSRNVRDNNLRTGDFKSGQLPAGPAGPQGPAGAPGGAANIIVRPAPPPAPEIQAGGSGMITVDCRPGEKAINGGTDKESAFKVTESTPAGGGGAGQGWTNPTSWRVTAENVAGVANYLTAYAVCLTP